MPRLRTTDPPASCIYDKQRNESRPSFPFFHRRYPPLPLRKPQSHIRHLTPFISRVNFPACGHTHNVNLIVSVSPGQLGFSYEGKCWINISLPFTRLINYALRKPLFEMWSVYMGIAQIAFAPHPLSAKQAPRAIFFRPYFFLSDGCHVIRAKKKRKFSIWT